MKRTINGYNVFAEDDLWEFVDKDRDFNAFIGQCLSHFVHFVIPRRDQTREIEQDYQIPERIDIASSSNVLLHRNPNNDIIVSFFHW